MKIYQKIIALFLVSAFGIFAFSCKEQPKNTNSVNTTTADANADIPPERTIDVQPSYAQSPTEAYKNLYEAVKAKDTEKIKSYMTDQTLALAQGQAAMKKEPVENQYKNGFLATTMSDTLPEIRDERIKDNMGAIEVYNKQEKKWDDTFFMFENGGWKLAIGEVFSGKYQSPGKGKAQIEMESSNTDTGLPPATDASKMPPAN